MATLDPCIRAQDVSCGARLLTTSYIYKAYACGNGLFSCSTIESGRIVFVMIRTVTLQLKNFF